jgi:hypothetical protein
MVQSNIGKQSDSHIVSVVLCAKLHEAIALVLIGDTVLGQVHIDCEEWEASSACCYPGQTGIGSWGVDTMVDQASPMGPPCMNSSQTSSSVICAAVKESV